MERSFYDAWHGLVLLATPTSPDCEYAKIEPTDDPHRCTLIWPDGSSAGVRFRDGRWEFAKGPCSDAATASGMYDG